MSKVLCLPAVSWCGDGGVGLGIGIRNKVPFCLSDLGTADSSAESTQVMDGGRWRAGGRRRGRGEGPVSISGRMGMRARARAIGIHSGVEEGLGLGPLTLDREL